jgi:hypothetical protein
MERACARIGRREMHIEFLWEIRKEIGHERPIRRWKGNIEIDLMLGWYGLAFSGSIWRPVKGCYREILE